MIKNTTTYGAQLTSLGDGSDASFWRQGGAWSTGTPTTSATSVSTSYVTLNTLTVAGGFLTYLINFTFGETGTLPTSATQIFAQVLDTTNSVSAVPGYQIGYLTTTSAPQFSGSLLYSPGSIQAFSLALQSKVNAGTATIAFSSITVIGIN